MKTLEKCEFRTISMEDEEEVERIRSMSGETSSSYSFPVLFCWQEELGLSICVEEDCFTVKYAMAGERDYFFPCGKPERVKEAIDRLLLQDEGVRFHFISEKNREFLQETYGEELLFLDEDRASCDYVIDVGKFLALRGKEYSKIRYYINKVRRQRQIRFLPIKPSDLSEVLEIEARWEVEHDTMDMADEKAQQMALAHYEELGMRGILFRENSRPVGYIIGRLLDDDTFDVHFMKKLPDAGRIDFYMLYILCRMLKGYVDYVNLEDDMGHEGLREKKLLYRPEEYQKVYIGVVGENE